MSSNNAERYLEISNHDITKLLKHTVKCAYRSHKFDVKNEEVVSKCLKLFSKDYDYSIVLNLNGELCSHYPSHIVILENEIGNSVKRKDSDESSISATNLKDLMKQARLARCRSRFPVPVIFYKGKNICRAATISGGGEMYLMSGMDYIFSSSESPPDDVVSNMSSSSESDTLRVGSSTNEWQLFNKIRGHDIRLLRKLNVHFICDLMMEKKKVKFGVNVTSSEKVDKKNRYSEFYISSIPYPGCEFFAEWSKNNYIADGMMFDWNQGYVDALLELPENLPSMTEIDWQKYKMWDLVQLTQNYLKILIQYIKVGEAGLLVHCISGWDRTPLFISLLRLSLWADGAIHKNLNHVEILYLTVAYDWFLFGHNLPDRLSKCEEIFFFCFKFLKYITSKEFSVNKKNKNNCKPITRKDSEMNVNGVLLDLEELQASYRGSNTSISSVSSLNSTKSSIDASPICFITNFEDEASIDNKSVNNGIFMTPCNSYKSSHEIHQGAYLKTSPVTVPDSCHRKSDNKAQVSSSVGSWQFISGSGSYKGSTSSNSIETSYVSNNSLQNQNHSCQPIQEECTRQYKLNQVRELFLNKYTGHSFCKTTSEGGVISGFLDHLVEKVGISVSRGSLD